MQAIVYARLNRQKQAVDEANKAIELSGTSTRGQATLAMVNGLLGRHQEARTLLGELLSKPEVPGFRWSYSLAAIYSYLNEREAAFECLRQACQEGDGAVIYLRYDPHFVELRNDCRFKAIVDRIGLESDEIVSSPGKGESRERHPNSGTQSRLEQGDVFSKPCLHRVSPKVMRAIIIFQDSNLPCARKAAPQFAVPLQCPPIPTVTADN